MLTRWLVLIIVSCSSTVISMLSNDSCSDGSSVDVHCDSDGGWTYTLKVPPCTSQNMSDEIANVTKRLERVEAETQNLTAEINSLEAKLQQFIDQVTPCLDHCLTTASTSTMSTRAQTGTTGTGQESTSSILPTEISSTNPSSEASPSQSSSRSTDHTVDTSSGLSTTTILQSTASESTTTVETITTESFPSSQATTESVDFNTTTISPIVCFNGGTPTAFGSCICPEYFDGVQCEIWQCENGGSYTSHGCDCLHFFTGSHCEQIVCVHGESLDGRTCTCNDEHYLGLHCETALCENGGTYLATMDLCVCPPDFFGKFCENASRE